MKEKTNKNQTTESQPASMEAAITTSHMSQDLKTAVLVVSVIANLFVFTAWLALQVTTKYDVQIANFLFNR